MNSKALFRLLVAATLVFAIAGGLVAAFPGNISDDWRTVTEWNGNGGFYEWFDQFALPANVIVRGALIALIVILGLFLVSVYVGLFLFWRFARIANVILTVIFVVVAPWAGLVILLPIEAGLYDLTMLCEGALIAFSYASPIKQHFESKPTA